MLPQTTGALGLLVLADVGARRGGEGQLLTCAGWLTALLHM